MNSRARIRSYLHSSSFLDRLRVRPIARSESLQNNRCYMLRREFLAAMAAAPLLAAKNHLGRARFSFITDEAAASPADAIAFAHKYGLQYVELRDVPGAKVHYCRLPE